MKKYWDTNEERLSIKAAIDKYGCQVMLIARENQPSFCYTVGLWERLQHPEFIVFGLPREVGHNLLNRIVSELDKGTIFQPNAEYDELLQGYPIMFRPLHSSNSEDYFGTAIRYYDTDAFPAWQVFWTDKAGNYAWQQGFEKKYKYYQPLLYKKLKFKFATSPNTHVLVDQEILKEGQPITEVKYNVEGTGLVRTDKEFDLDQLVLAPFSSLVKLDASINDLFDLSKGHTAKRNSGDSDWDRTD